MALPLVDRLFLGGLRNLLCGATGVLHHAPFHRALQRDDFPVRVQHRYDFAHSPGQTPQLRRAYRTSDRRIPFLVHAAEGTDAVAAGEIERLAAANVLRQNTVVVHAIACSEADRAAMAAAKACVAWCPEAGLRLYGRAADVAALRAAGVRIGLGSESPMAGSRDLLSSLASASAGGALAPEELLELATVGSAEVARLPRAGESPGSAADLLVTRSPSDLLAGRRDAVALVIVRGAALYGEPGLMEAACAAWAPLQVDGAPRALERALHRRLASLLRAHGSVLSRVPWLQAVRP
jgi:cytosine/adenosine deaminase-related metal-dependent hydrolase